MHDVLSGYRQHGATDDLPTKSARKTQQIIRQNLGGQGLPGCDYVIVARDAALRAPAAHLLTDVEKALAQVNRRLAASRR